MRAREYLRQIDKYNKLIENKMFEREEWRSMALSITGKTEGDRVQSSGNQQKMASAVERLIDLEREIDEAIDRLADAKKEIISTIETLTAKKYDILHKVYIQGMELQDIAIARGRSYSSIKNLHKEALASLQKILDEREL